MIDDPKKRDDVDPIETQEWRDAVDNVIDFNGKSRAAFLLNAALQHAQIQGIRPSCGVNTPYLNTIPVAEEAQMPDDGGCFEELLSLLRWNAMAMVVKTNRFDDSLGGHIASYASIATLYEIGFNYFFRAPTKELPGDLVFFQGHSSPGIYARAYLEGRLSEQQLALFRQESKGGGLSSYPHPWLMPDFWEFPTVSMGLGPYMAIYQARFQRYLENRGLRAKSDRKVWAFCGDGEMDEPESIGALPLAARERLDQLIFVINCNLQRLDGPVRGNSQVIQELEATFTGAGWRVIKVIWGRGWDALFSKDKTGALLDRIGQLVDGEYQNITAKGVPSLRADFFGKSPALQALIADYSDADLARLLDGGHDPQKVYAAFAAAMQSQGKPTVILAKTVKGYGMGKAGLGLNIAHNQKKMSDDDIRHLKTHFQVPIRDELVEQLDFYRPDANAKVMHYLKTNRQALQGGFPARWQTAPKRFTTPALDVFKAQLEGSGDREISTTMVAGRILNTLLKDAAMAPHVVPIFPDESRTFGMEGLYRQIGIYASEGQKYVPEDQKQLMYYRESQQGQILQEGICEAGAIASWIAAATAYCYHQVPMIPIYSYYAMFGFQRVGDFVWAAADMRARGFILGGLHGRTTLAGEGLQHQDAHNLLMYSFVPNCMTYEPTFAYELAVIFRHGLERMFEKQEDVFFYITMMNENYLHPAMPAGVEAGILQGLYLFRAAPADVSAARRVQLLGSGPILREVIRAADLLAERYEVHADVWSVTSFNELRRDLNAVNRHNLLHPEAPRESHVRQCLARREGPVVAATDNLKLFADQIRSQVEAPYFVLGTDGFGRSDTRTALREFFEVSAEWVAYTALVGLVQQKKIGLEVLTKARMDLGIDVNKRDPMVV